MYGVKKLTLELNGSSQNDLVNLFFDWYDYNQQFPDKKSSENLKQIRSLIQINTTTGIKN
tara:strand:+ start:620 stop:799 length:180 start_codon:yes stop_codon:yes gene_type:complete